jgi:hypothetical protein
VDQALEEIERDPQQDRFVAGAAEIIGADPLGYVLRRVSRLAEAVLQPHGTLFFSGPSLRDVALDWLREDGSPAGLVALTQTEGFWPKLSLYLLQYAAYLAGLAGIWLTRRRWPRTLPLIGLIAYTLLIHLILESIPRYLFPTLLFWWIFAGITIHYIAPWRRRSTS